MTSIKTAFGKAASGKPRISTFWLLVFAIAILDDEERREEKRRKKRDARPPRKAKPPAGPRPPWSARSGSRGEPERFAAMRVCHHDVY